jgi:phosphatidate cytidylyltransferase
MAQGTGKERAHSVTGPPLALSNLGIRLLTAAVVLPPLLLLMFLGPAWGFYALVAVAVVVASRELFQMTHPGDVPAQVIGIAMCVAVSAALYFAGKDPRILLTVALGVPIIGVLIPLWRLGDIRTAALRTMTNVAAPFYIGAALATLAMIRRDFEFGSRWVFLCLCFSWLADTGGYFFGRFLGKTKLYEAVSPKKTRAGFVGAIVGSTVGGLIAHFLYLPNLSLAAAIGLGVVCGALGQFGDLVESLVKRSTGIKDSGSIVPGHGGMLDRIDALLIVSPLVYLFEIWTANGR